MNLNVGYNEVKDGEGCNTQIERKRDRESKGERERERHKEKTKRKKERVINRQRERNNSMKKDREKERERELKRNSFFYFHLCLFNSDTSIREATEEGSRNRHCGRRNVRKRRFCWSKCPCVAVLNILFRKLGTFKISLKYITILQSW